MLKLASNFLTACAEAVTTISSSEVSVVFALEFVVSAAGVAVSAAWAGPPAP